MVTTKELINFKAIIEECRSLLETVIAKEERSIDFIFIQLYSKMILTMYEIFTLLDAGFPEGAMALARIAYETMVIMTFLEQRKTDHDLIERFCDDLRIKTCTDHIKYCEWNIANGVKDSKTHDILREREDEFDLLLKKHGAYASKQGEVNFFHQYWWAGNGKSFNKIRKEANFPDDYLYKLSCYRAHAGMTGMLRFDNSEEGLLLGPCEGGKDIPIQFALLTFSTSTKLYFFTQSIDCSQIITKMQKLLETISLKN